MRPFDVSDASAAFSWFSDPEVMRYNPSGPDLKIEDTTARIRRYIEHQRRHGFSKWVIMDRDTQCMIGDSGFFFLPDNQRVELGYRLSRSHWGQGLATEVARRWIEVAGDYFSQSPIYAFAHSENSASLRVINKLGFRFLRHEVIYGLEAPLFALPVNSTTSEQSPAAIPAPLDG